MGAYLSMATPMGKADEVLYIPRIGNLLSIKTLELVGTRSGCSLDEERSFPP